MARPLRLVVLTLCAIALLSACGGGRKKVDEEAQASGGEPVLSLPKDGDGLTGDAKNRKVSDAVDVEKLEKTVKSIEKRVVKIESKISEITPTIKRLTLIENDIRHLIFKMEEIAYADEGAVSGAVDQPVAAQAEPAQPLSLSDAGVVTPLATGDGGGQESTDDTPVLSLATPLGASDAAGEAESSGPTLSLKMEDGDQTPSSISASEPERDKEPVVDEPGFGVHLASYSARANLETGWRKLRRNFPKILGDLEHMAVAVRPKGKKQDMYRLVAGPYPSRKAARGACARLKKRGQYCGVTDFE